jgi:hypothetical protein
MIKANGKKWKQLFPGGSDFGKSEFEAAIDFSPVHLLSVLFFVSVFIILAFLGDLWPVKSVGYQAYAYFYKRNIASLTMQFELHPAMRYSFGSAARYWSSLFYLVLVKLFYLAIPQRLLCLRAVSIFSTSVSLFFIYRIGAILFCRAIGLLVLLVIVISPAYVEGYRAFGYIPVTSAVACSICYLLVVSLNRSKVVIKTILLSVLSYATLSLYVVGRLIILLPLIVFGIYLKRYWRQLLLFVLVLVGLVLALDYMIGDSHLDIKKSILMHSEWLEPSSPQTPIDAEVLWGRFKYNITFTLRRLAIMRSPFYDSQEESWAQPSAVINPVYVPFLIIGLLINLFRKRMSNVVILGWLFLFLIVPHFADWITPRRFVLGLTPIYFLIAIGMWWVFNFLAGLISSADYRKTVTYVSLAGIFLVGGCNIFSYFEETAKPDYDYSHNQLKRLATYISETGRHVRTIRFNRCAADLLWGNPYFDRPIIDNEIIDKMEFDFVSYPGRKKRCAELLDQIESAREEGGGILYIHLLERQSTYTTEPLRNPGESDGNWPFAEIEMVNENMREEVELEQLPGIDEVYFLHVK